MSGLTSRHSSGLAERVAARETVTFESLHRRKDGTAFPVEIRAAQFKQGDRCYGLSLVREITERKQTGRAARRVIRHRGRAGPARRRDRGQSVSRSPMTGAGSTSRMFEQTLLD